MLELVHVQLALRQRLVDRGVIGELHDVQVDAIVRGEVLEHAPCFLVGLGGADLDGDVVARRVIGGVVGVVGAGDQAGRGQCGRRDGCEGALDTHWGVSLCMGNV